MSTKREEGMHITTQFRAKRGMVYELKCDADRLNLHVTPRETESDAGEWLIEARASRSPDAVCITAWGPTKADALKSVAQSWGESAMAQNLPRFDWEAVTKALADVRAL